MANVQIRRILTPEQARAVCAEAVGNYRGSTSLGSFASTVAFSYVSHHGVPRGLDRITVAGELAQELFKRGAPPIPKFIDQLERAFPPCKENTNV